MFICVHLWFLSAVCAADVDLFVTDYGENPTAEQRPLIEQPLIYSNAQRVTIQTADGKSVTYTAPRKIAVHPKSPGDPRLARLFASIGEYEPFSFLLRPKEAMAQVSITPGDLKGDGGVIAASNLRIASVEEFHGGGANILYPVGRAWDMPAYSTEFFWCTIHVPDDAKAGTYRGEVTVAASGTPVGAIAIELEILPIRLEDPPISVGFNYSDPKDPKMMAAHFADMRRHGMTCVAPLYKFHLPVYDTDTSELGKLIEAYKAAGFRPPMYFATPMDLTVSTLAGFGSETSKRWQQKYIKTMGLLDAEVRKHDLPVMMSIGDELTNKGIEGVKIAGRLAKFVWEELPEITTTSDMNGYMEVMAMAPYLNVATFNNGWDGIDHHNKGRRLINRAFIEEVQKTGAIPWFVNAGSGRLPFGFFLWKMSKYGVRGKVEWYYNLDNERGSLVETDGATVYPTLDYERCREGVDDLKYLCTLEKLVAEAKKAGRASEQTRSAEALLKRIADGIADDWSAYTGGGQRFPADGFDVVEPEKAAALGSLNAVRRAVAEQIMAMQSALLR